MDQKDTTTFIHIDTADRQVKTNTNCDASNDDLYIKPFEASSQITLSSTSSTVTKGSSVAMNLMDSAGNPTISLRTVVLPNPS
jgi:hypothetical protein